MLFKYQAPATYKSTSIVFAGRKIQVKNGVVESNDDIFNILAPLGFKRIEAAERKVAVAKA